MARALAVLALLDTASFCIIFVFKEVLIDKVKSALSKTPPGNTHAPGIKRVLFDLFPSNTLTSLTELLSNIKLAAFLGIAILVFLSLFGVNFNSFFSILFAIYFFCCIILCFFN